jgi:D-xylose transport system substrate-binding protein
MKGKTVLFGVFLLGIGIFTGCQRVDKGPQNKNQNHTPKIGFVMDSFIEERWTRDRDVFLSTAKSLGAQVILQIGEENSQTQEAEINYLLDQGINSLVLIAADPHYLSRAIIEAKRRNVPTLLYERIVYNAGADLYLAYDAVKTGELQAQGIVDAIHHGSLVLINGPRNDSNAEAAHRGVFNILTPLVDSKGIRILSDYWPNSTNSEEPAKVIEDLLNSGNKIDGVIAFSDLQAEAVIRTLALHRLAGKVAVAGADADLAACQRIAEGTQTMTVYKPIEQIAAKAAELAVYMARNERVTVHNAIEDGTYRVPYYELTPIGVDKTNLRETVIKDGFHLEEDVYRNVLPH